MGDHRVDIQLIGPGAGRHPMLHRITIDGGLDGKGGGREQREDDHERHKQGEGAASIRMIMNIHSFTS